MSIMSVFLVARTSGDKATLRFRCVFEGCPGCPVRRTSGHVPETRRNLDVRMSGMSAP
jgi:hypothetical protein